MFAALPVHWMAASEGDGDAPAPVAVAVGAGSGLAMEPSGPVGATVGSVTAAEGEALLCGAWDGLVVPPHPTTANATTSAASAENGRARRRAVGARFTEGA